MSKRPRLSLIISVYNQSAFAPLVLSSAVNQSIDDRFEIIVCDDGSSDRYLEAIRSVVSLGRIDIRYIWQPDLGFRLARSRNNAIRCAQGEILVFVDGDTLLLPTFLQDHLVAHQAAKALVCGLRVTVNSTDLQLDEAAMERINLSLSPEHLRQRRWLRSSRPWMACLGGNFSVPNVAKVAFDEQFESWGSEDRDLAWRLFRDGFGPCLLRQPNAIQLRTSDDVWTNMTPDEVIAFLMNKSKLRAKYPGGEMEPSLSLVRWCSFEAARDSWVMAPRPSSQTADEILDQFEEWYEIHGAYGGRLPASVRVTHRKDAEPGQ